MIQHAHMSRRGLIRVAFFGALAASALLTTPSFAFEEASNSEINTDAAGLAIRGYDPVAYFASSTPTLGKADLNAKHKGATYHFANAANRDSFVAAPDTYLPQYGGFCALGTAKGRKFDGDPKLWRVEGGKLYLNVSPDAQTFWLKDIPGNIKDATENWPQIKNKAPNTL